MRSKSEIGGGGIWERGARVGGRGMRSDPLLEQGVMNLSDELRCVCELTVCRGKTFGFEWLASYFVELIEDVIHASAIVGCYHTVKGG